MAWDAVIFDFEDTLVDLSRGRSTKGAPMYYSGAKGVPPTRDPNGAAFVDVLGRLVEAGTPVAIVTNSPEAAMGRWFAEQHFAYPIVVVGFHDTVLHRPSPHPLLEALSRLGVAPSPRVLAVGDSSDDLEAAQPMTDIHMTIAKVATIGYLLPVVTGVLTLRSRTPARRKVHLTCALLVVGLTLAATVTGAWMLWLAERVV